MATSYILRGVTSKGAEVFFTGRAGQGWTSADKAEAFAYGSQEAAARKAGMHNAYCAIHGVWFTAQPT